ncbi:hypothetical protein [Microbacterium aurantiacum]|uniref:Uncharacterized protein n=1 Tax=Microbacterium aurantiacum TaxID=162393 RepID=A0ABT8FRE6_9MICO|nr:hypothetical protein [Microbacterium aurantiacum]MDN4463888.1 hypothetical protein [Microbacterium aurantiacum]
MPVDDFEAVDRLAQQVGLVGERDWAAGGAPEGASVREVRDEVAELVERALRLGAAARKQPQPVLGLERCPQGALVVVEGARERQEFGLSALNTS